MNSKQITAVTLGAALLLAGYGSEGSGKSAATKGPVVVEMWGWGEERLVQPIVDAFNKSHPGIQLKFVKQVDNPSTQQNLRNAVKAGTGIPCLVQGFGE